MALPYTVTAETALGHAQFVVSDLGQTYVGTEHLLLGLIWAGEGVASQVLERHGVTEDKVTPFINTKPGSAADENLTTLPTPRMVHILDQAEALAMRNDLQSVGTELLLAQLILDRDNKACNILKKLGVNQKKIFSDCLYAAGVDLQATKNELSGKAQAQSGKSTGILEQFSNDLTAMAAEGKLDPMIGRETELARLIQILSRRTKNNPCFVGEPGVGKTAIVEGFAKALVTGAVPDSMKGKHLIGLDLASVVAGTKYRGEFEDRIKKIIREVKNAGDVILFIDEIHTMIGAGGAEGSLDAANILKPALARGEVQIIGATTRAEYTKYIEKDAALERRFQPIQVDEPTVDETIQILQGLKSRFEDHHSVEYTDEALEAAAKLSKRYVSDRYLPDKAIDLIDEAASRKMMDQKGEPEEIQAMRDEMQKLMEEMEYDLATGKLKEASEAKKQYTQDVYDITLLEEKWKKKQGKNIRKVTAEDVAAVVTMWTNIPVSQLQTSERKRLMNMEKLLHKRVIGQEEAVTAVSKAVKRNRVGLKDPNRPVGSFLFLGPTGVGKTELSKALAEAVFGSEEEIIRVDMSEYMEKHSVSKMIGSPPGYVGFDDGGQLSEQVRRKPYSVILFDEIEKAHPDVFNILLQVLDDGRITDSQGRTVDFKNTIIIMTSNAGANRIISPKLLGFGGGSDPEQNHEKMKNAVMQEVRQIFRPEFLNRIDEIMVFKALTKEEVREIAKIMMKDLIKRAGESMGLDLRVSRYVYDYLAEKGYDVKYGARPLRRVIQTDIEDPLADFILSGDIEEGTRVDIRIKNGNLFIDAKKEN